MCHRQYHIQYSNVIMRRNFRGNSVQRAEKVRGSFFVLFFTLRYIQLSAYRFMHASVQVGFFYCCLNENQSQLCCQVLSYGTRVHLGKKKIMKHNAFIHQASVITTSGKLDIYFLCRGIFLCQILSAQEPFTSTNKKYLICAFLKKIVIPLCVLLLNL